MIATDKQGNEIRVGDTVSVVYGGDHHFAKVADLYVDSPSMVPHVSLQLTTPAVVPAASVTLLEYVSLQPTTSTEQPGPEEPSQEADEKEAAGQGQAEPDKDPEPAPPPDEPTPPKPTAPAARRAPARQPHTKATGGKKP